MKIIDKLQDVAAVVVIISGCIVAICIAITFVIMTWSLL